MDKDFQDRIDEYLLHGDTMTEEAKAQFLKEIEEDADKREQYEFTKNVKKAFESRGDKLKAMAEFQKEYETRDDKSNFRKKLVWFSGIAAVLVIGFFVINPLFVYESTNSNVRGEEDDVFEMEAPADSVANDSTSTDTITLHHE